MKENGEYEDKMKYNKYLYLLNSIFIFSVSYFNRFITPSQMYNLYTNNIYVALFYSPIFLSVIYFDVLYINYNIVSRYTKKAHYIFEKVYTVFKFCVQTSLCMVGIPLIIAISYFNKIDMTSVIAISTLMIRYVLLSFFIGTACFSFSLTLSFLQKKEHYKIVFGLSLLPILLMIKEILLLNQWNDWMYYVEFSIIFDEKQNSVESVLVNNGQILAYCIILILLVSVIFIDKIEFLNYEKNN